MTTQAGRVFILDHYFASKSFAAVCEAFSRQRSTRLVKSTSTAATFLVDACLLEGGGNFQHLP
jgi:hypothetical protein